MRNQAIVILVFSCTVALAGCGQVGLSESDYIETVMSARRAIPAAVEIEALFGDADHFITYYGSNREEVLQWNTETFLFQRYRLQMAVDVQVDYVNNTVSQVGVPEFGIFETVRVYDANEAGDSRGSDVGRQLLFGVQQWNLVVESDGDFSKIGFPLIEGAPIKGYDKFIRQVRDDRIPVSLLGRNLHGDGEQ